MGVEYNRYLQEVVQLLESDPDFRSKLEKSDPEDIRVRYRVIKLTCFSSGDNIDLSLSERKSSQRTGVCKSPCSQQA